MASFMKEFGHLKIKLEEIKNATNNFGNKFIGSGGFGYVYVGELSHSKGRSIVAMKRLNRQFDQGEAEFLKEIVTLSRYKHPNLISLLGYCDEGHEKILVYEYASKRSLDKHVSDPSVTWTQRLKICLGAAMGLAYLHDPKDTYQRVLHCDIKSSNILLDENLNAKIADFGLAKIAPANEKNSFLVTNASGTPGYCDPQYIKTYTLTKESDVYSFGVVLFEVLCGRLCFQGQFNLLWWKNCYKDKRLHEIIFQELMQQMDPTCLETFSDIAFQCLQYHREHRPTISRVVEKLENALETQELHNIKEVQVLKRYGGIIKAVVTPLKYRSAKELVVLLSNGVLLGEGKTWFSLNDKEQHCVMISIHECLYRYDIQEKVYSKYPNDYNSRFHGGTYNTRGKSFSIRGRYIYSNVSELLSPGTTYKVNLVFKCPDVFRKKHTGKQEYIALTYQLEGEEDKRMSIVYLEDKREDEWLMAGLYQFTTTSTNDHSSNAFVELDIDFSYHKYWKGGLEIQGIEFQPLENVVELEHDDQIALLDEYQQMLVAAAYPPLFCRSIRELKLLLSRGVLLNSGKTWFKLNHDGQHCEMISIATCLIPDAEKKYFYTTRYNSRFPLGSLFEVGCKYRICVRTQFLTPYITYRVNFVFKYSEKKDNTLKQCSIGLKYELGRTRIGWISYLAYKREDNWWMVELGQFTCKGNMVKLEITFQGTDSIIDAEGIEFQPMEKAVEHQVLEDETEKEADMQSVSDSDDTYWEHKLPNDYQNIIGWSKDGVQWTTKKELYSIFCTGFLINNGHAQWFFLDKNGKRCQMLSAREVIKTYVKHPSSWHSLPESRFGESCVVGLDKYLRLNCDIKSGVLSPGTTYACYLVFKLPAKDQSRTEGLVEVRYEDLDNPCYIYLVSPPNQNPLHIRKSDKNAINRVKRPKIKGLPEQRSDGWMEVQVWKFRTATATKIIPMRLSLYERCGLWLNGFIIQGIEFRPI